MKIFKVVFILFILSIQLSCFVVHKQTINDFDFCFDPENAIIGNNIELNGHYEIEYSSINEETGYVSSRTAVIVFFQ